MPARTDNSGRRWIHDECGTEHHISEDCPLGRAPSWPEDVDTWPDLPPPDEGSS